MGLRLIIIADSMCKGFIGLAAYSVDVDAPVQGKKIQSSLLAIVKETGQISSLSYGYNAGAFYRMFLVFLYMF